MTIIETPPSSPREKDMALSLNVGVQRTTEPVVNTEGEDCSFSIRCWPAALVAGRGLFWMYLLYYSTELIPHLDTAILGTSNSQVWSSLVLSNQVMSPVASSRVATGLSHV